MWTEPDIEKPRALLFAVLLTIIVELLLLSSEKPLQFRETALPFNKLKGETERVKPAPTPFTLFLVNTLWVDWLLRMKPPLAIRHSYGYKTPLCALLSNVL